MHLKIAHVTEYRYDAPVAYALQRLRLTPRSGPGQQVDGWTTHIEGGTIEARYDDQFMNRVELVSATPGTEMIRIVAEGTVDTSDIAGVIGAHQGFAPLWLFGRETPLTQPGKAMRDFARTVSGSGDLDHLHRLAAAIHKAVRFEPGRTDTGTSAEDAFAAGHGVCQDHAHIFLGLARQMRLPARYVSGYLRMDDREEQTASHAWAEAHVEGLGWVGFDPANGISPDERYVRIATGLDYRDAAPVSGIRMGAATESLAVSLIVEQ